MKRYLIQYDISGNGDFAESFVDEFGTAEQAIDAAYQAAKIQFDSNVVYSATELTKALAEEYGITWDESPRLPWREPADIPPEFGGPISMRP